MLHFHGTPISGSAQDILPFYKDRRFLVSFEHPSQLNVVINHCKEFVIDNGAFSHWRKGRGSIDIYKYKSFVQKVEAFSNYKWCFIPDIIDGDAKQNDLLIDSWVNMYGKYRSVPVYHYHEDLSRLKNLMQEFPVVALGSSSMFKNVGSPQWFTRTNQIFDFYLSNQPQCKLHGLRMLNKKIFTKYHYYSGDSTNVGRNIMFYKERHKIQTRLEAANRLAESIEQHKSLYDYSNNLL